MQQAFSVIFVFLIDSNILSHFFQPVTGIHHDLAGRKELTGLVGRAGGRAAAAFGTTVSIQQVFPAQVHHILSSKFMGSGCLFTGWGQFRLHGIQHFFLDGFHVFHLSHRLQSGIIGIGKGQDNMQVFGIGQVVQKGKNTCYVQPPRTSFNYLQPIIAHAID